MTTFPTGEVSVVHVWRQDCADCAPAFEAAERLGVGRGRWGVPVHNVAFGPFDLETARARGLDEGLVQDPGTGIVRPLGIGTFTTLVVDADGFVQHRDQPQGEGYVGRVERAITAARLPGRGPNLPGSGPSISAFDRAFDRAEEPDGGGLVLLLSQLSAFASVLVGVLWCGAVHGALLRRAGPAPLRKLGQELDLQAGQRCPYCHAGVGGLDWCVRCEGCGATYHEECGRDLGTCSALGCGRWVGAAPARERA